MYVYNYVLKTVIVLNVALIQYSVVGFFRLIRLAEDWPLERFSTYSLFVDLLDNYNPQLNEPEPEPTEEEKAEINRFMLQMENYSMVMNELTDFLLEKSELLWRTVIDQSISIYRVVKKNGTIFNTS